MAVMMIVHDSYNREHLKSIYGTINIKQKINQEILFFTIIPKNLNWLELKLDF